MDGVVMFERLAILVFLTCIFSGCNSIQNFLGANRVAPFEEIQFISKDIGFAKSYKGTIWKTQNGGKRWEPLTSEQDWVIDFYFLSENVGFGLRDHGQIISTKDGGNTWETQYIGAEVKLTEVLFLDESQGWVAGNYGYFFKTTDGGASWQVAQHDYMQTLASNGIIELFFLNEEVGFAVGFGGMILRTNDGGDTWQTQESGLKSSISDVYFTSELEGVAVAGNCTVLRTTDGGEHWTNLRSQMPIPDEQCRARVHFRGIHFYDEDHGVIVGYEGLILRTEDGGVSWDLRQLEGPDYPGLSDVFFSSDGYGIAVGQQFVRPTKKPVEQDMEFVVLQTNDGGITWQVLQRGTEKVVNQTIIE